VNLLDVTLYFDTNIGTAVPKALELLRLPVGIKWHHNHFAHDTEDDVWLPTVGANGWFVVGHDKKFHARPNELAALKQHEIGCFYLWGAEAPRWEKMRCFVRAYERIVDAALNTQRPFAYNVRENGRIWPVKLGGASG
jgi:hypothetical protein